MRHRPVDLAMEVAMVGITVVGPQWWAGTVLGATEPQAVEATLLHHRLTSLWQLAILPIHLPRPQWPNQYHHPIISSLLQRVARTYRPVRRRDTKLRV